MKNYQISFIDIFWEDLERALDYYRTISINLEDRFELDLNSAIESLEKFCYYEIKFENLRIYNFKNFPYCLYFEVDETDKYVFVMAILHQHAEFPIERLKS